MLKALPALLFFILSLGITAPAQAQESELLKIRAALEEAWNRAPLTVHNAVFITKPPQAYGMYNPVKKAVFDSIDPIMIYCEPMGYNVEKQGEFYQISLSADFSILNKSGEVLGGQENFYQWKTRAAPFPLN